MRLEYGQGRASSNLEMYLAAQTALIPQDQRVPVRGDCHFYGLGSTEPRETLRWAEAGDSLSGSPSAPAGCCATWRRRRGWGVSGTL